MHHFEQIYIILEILNHYYFEVVTSFKSYYQDTELIFWGFLFLMTETGVHSQESTHDSSLNVGWKPQIWFKMHFWKQLSDHDGILHGFPLQAPIWLQHL